MAATRPDHTQHATNKESPMPQPTLRRSGPAALAAGCVLLLAGCTSATATTGSSTPQATTSRSTSRQAPGASGIIAEIDGKTLQVQGTSSQTSVTYTGATTFSRQVSGDAADVTVGSCVRMATDSDTATANTATAVTASSITVTTAVDGQCAGFGGAGGQGGAGGRPSGAPSGAPSGLPSGAPSGVPSGGPGDFGRMVAGEVTAVSDTTITVAASQPGSAETSTVTVTVGDSTLVTRTAKASASALKVGLCASARGSADSTGAVTATSIALSEPVDGNCGLGR